MDSSVDWISLCNELRSHFPPHISSSLLDSIDCEMQEGNEEKKLNLIFIDEFSKETFQRKCLPKLKEILHYKKPQTTFAIDLTVDKAHTNKDRPRQHALNHPAIILPSQQPFFDDKYIFETFVVGSTNQFAHAACLAVAHQPGHCYNPLFIFGPAGLGKTHLLKAIGYKISKASPTTKIQFLTSETFTNDLIQAIRQDQMKEFRERFRSNCDLLLLDDVHFFAGKERTQEEFFYTFNYLHESKKQIVITSDRYPKDITGLENRLLSRFEWGLVADIQPPEIETRIAILKNKAELDNIILNNEVAHFIATHITTNIRELEGSLHRLSAYASLTGRPISLELAQETLRELGQKNIKHDITPEEIFKIVALEFNIKTTEIKSEKKTRNLSTPRQVCMYLLRRYLRLSYPEIGKIMGGKDHTTILHGVRRISDLLRKDNEMLLHISNLENLLK